MEKNDETKSKFVTADEALNDIVCIGREGMQMRLRLNTTSGLEALLAHQLFSLFASHFVPYSTSTEVLTFRCAIAWPTCAFRGSLSRGTRSVTSIAFKTLTLVAKHQHTDLRVSEKCGKRWFVVFTDRTVILCRTRSF